MARFDRYEESSTEKQRKIDRSYTLLMLAKESLINSGDYFNACALEEIASVYRKKGATMRYEAIPRP